MKRADIAVDTLATDDEKVMERDEHIPNVSL